jgi:O-antigen biosynthesis protein
MNMPANGFLYYSTSDGSSTATSSGDAIIRVDVNGQNPTTIASGFTDLIEAMALDQSGNRMFVLDNTGFFAGSATGNTIWSVDLSTGVATKIFTGTSIANSGSSLTLSPALSYDSVNGEVYFTQAGILMRMNADGSNPTAVTSSPVSSAISGITLDVANNLAFVEDATTANRDIFSVDLNTGVVTKIYQNTGFVMGTGLAYNSADGNIYFTQASTTGGPPNLYKIPSNAGSTLSSATLVASSIEGSSAAQITFNQTGDEAYVRGITSGGTTINQVDLATGAVSTVVSPSGQTGLSVIFAAGTTPTADLSVTVNDGVTSVVPGNIDTYTITVTNNGPATVTSLTLSDGIPAGLSNPVFSPPSQGSYDPGSGLWSGLSLTSGQSVSITLSGVINPNPTGTISNTVTVSPIGVTDPVPGNNSSTDTDIIAAQADLSVTIDDGVTSVLPGTIDTYTISVTNNGPDTVHSFNLVDAIPAGLSNPIFGPPSQGSYDPGSGLWGGLSLASGQSVSITLSAAVNPDATGTISNTVTVSPPVGGTDPNLANNTSTDTDAIPCYCAGTLILTDRGEVPVETLAIGDKVATADGVARVIRWIGRRSYSGRFARGNHVLPICIKASALDENLPHRDLWISPNHAMFLHGALIEAQDLVNGVSIVRAAGVERVDYFHIELETHDIIVAEGALSESFVDDDSRGMFQNAHEFEALYPNEHARPDPYCAPRLAFGTQVEAARRQIARRAGTPYTPPTAESRPRALVVDNQIPTSNHDGGANAILDHMRALQAAGFHVSFLPLRHTGANTRALSSLGVKPLSVQDGGLSAVMRAHAGQFDLVYLHRLESAMYCLKLARQYFDAQIVYSVADLHHIRLKTQSKLDHEHASELLQQAQCVAVQELAAALSCDCVITHSESEAAKLEQLASIAAAHKVRVVPWSVRTAAVQQLFADRSGAAFIGSFAHAPNVDAARWLVDEIMPLVWREVPDLRCVIAGSDMSGDLRQQLARPGVKVLGRVEQLSDVFEQVRLTVAPLRFGAGLKDKVLRSMAAGLPCIGTPEAFDGMQELPEAIRSVCRRDTACGLAMAIVSMHRDEAANTSCSRAGLNYMDAFYNEARIEALIREIAQPALDRFRDKAKSKSPASEVLQFVAAPSSARASIAANAPGRERRIVFN